jgi:alpha-1,2-mannosyltransferase
MLTPEYAAAAIRLRLSKLGLSKLIGALGGGEGRVLTIRGLIVLAVLAIPVMIFQVGAADLGVYRHGASVVVHGSSLYAPGFAAATPSHLPFTYPPFAAVAALVLLPLPQVLTAQLWGAATILMLAWCVKVSFRRFLDRLPFRADLALAALTVTLLATRPVFDHLGDGQVDILLMTLCLADILTAQPRWPRGMLVGVATAIKLVPGIFIPYLWITGRRRAAAVAAATFVLCETVAALTTFGDSHRYWTSLVFNTERPGYTAGYKNQSLRGILLRLFPAPERSYLLFAAAVIIAVMALAGGRHAASRGNLIAGATLAGLAGVLASPVSWIHATVWILPAIGIILDRGTSAVRIGIAALITVALVAGLPYWPNILHGLPHPVVVLFQRSFGLICLALVLALPAANGGLFRPTAGAA